MNLWEMLPRTFWRLLFEFRKVFSRNFRKIISGILEKLFKKTLRCFSRILREIISVIIERFFQESWRSFFRNLGKKNLQNILTFGIFEIFLQTTSKKVFKEAFIKLFQIFLGDCSSKPLWDSFGNLFEILTENFEGLLTEFLKNPFRNRWEIIFGIFESFILDSLIFLLEPSRDSSRYLREILPENFERFP